MPWDQVLQFMSVAGGMLATIGYLLAKLVVQPEIETQRKGIMEWAQKEFATMDQFKAHCEIAEEREHALRRDLDRLQRLTDGGHG